MKVLVVGGGGREHTLAWKIRQSPLVETIFCAPGNAGIARHAECVDIAPDDIDRLASFAREKSIDLTVVGPELPLTLGIVDTFQAAGLRIFGPRAGAANIEASKTFAKGIMEKYGIPTGAYRTFTDPDEAAAYVREIGPPVVIKADGLAAGKGVTVAHDKETAIDAIDRAMRDRAFGDAGQRILVEECLEGEEASMFVFTDGRDIVPMPTSQDHKPVYDDDQGPNTGGMGAYSPAPVVTDAMFAQVIDRIMLPTIRGMAEEGFEYQGVLYAGLMITEEGPKTIEFNARFGDPENQVVMPRLRSDIVPILEACIDGGLGDVDVSWNDRAAVCVVLASGGYPGTYQKGKAIKGIALAENDPDVVVFHAGTRSDAEEIVTNGGRVLGVTSLGDDIPSAIDKAYQAVGRIEFDQMHYRTDIGRKALRRL